MKRTHNHRHPEPPRLLGAGAMRHQAPTSADLSPLTLRERQQRLLRLWDACESLKPTCIAGVEKP